MRAKGFTLIELVVVIVILGILAVVAAPRFLNYSHDARAASIRGMKAAVDGAAQLVYSKTVIDGEENNPSYHIDLGSQTGHVAFGYPTVERGGIENFLNADAEYHDLEAEWVWAAHNNGTLADPDYWLITQSSILGDFTGSDFNTAIEQTQCYVKYTAVMEEGGMYQAEAVITGC